MKLTIKRIVIVIILMSPSSLFAQKFSQDNYSKWKTKIYATWAHDMTKQLKVGDTLPDLELRNVKNYKGETLKLSDVKAKLIIIDFWSITCSGCLESVPVMEKLQDEFGKSIQIIMVNRDEQNAVDYTAAVHMILNKTKLPMYNNDQVFYKYFYYNGVPAHVWLDSNRVIKSFGSGENTSETSIASYLNQRINPDFKTDILFKDYNYHLPALVEGNGRNFIKNQYYSAILNRIDGIGSQPYFSQEPDSTGKHSTLFFENTNLKTLFNFLLRYENHAETGIKLNYIYSANRIIYELKDSSLFLYQGKEPSIGQWQMNHTYCYELHIPEKLSDKTFKFMRTDLERFFGVTAKIENRIVSCWVLKEDSTKFGNRRRVIIPDSAAVDGSRKFGYTYAKLADDRHAYDHKTNSIYFKNVPGSHIVYFWEDRDDVRRDKHAPLIIDGISDDSKVFNLVLHGHGNSGSDDKKDFPGSDFELFRKDLTDAGLILLKENRSIPMMVIKDVN